MAAFINTNIASLNAQRNLNSSQSALQTSLQRLSSGLRINSAKDDAAGLAIASRFTTQIKGLDQAVRNANDGISLAQTAEGSLGEITNNLQRIRELAVQASNSTNSASDRAAINQEVQQRLAEIDRTSSQTSFNGQKILDGSFGTANFQIGANAGETISVALNTSMRTAEIGKIATTTTAGAIGATAAGGNFTTGALTLGDFSVVTAAQVDGYNAITPASQVFNQAAADQVNGSNSSVTLALGASGYDFTAQPAANVSGFNQQTFTSTGTVTDSTGAGVSALDFSGAHLAQFDVTSANINGGAAIGITLNQTYADTNELVTDIQGQLDAVTGGVNDYVVSYSGGQLKIASSAGTFADAVSISNADQNATARGLTNTSGAAGVAANAGVSFTVDGTVVNLATDYTVGGTVVGQDAADALAADISAQLAGTGNGYSVAVDDATGGVTITHAGTSAADTNAVVISASDAAAQSIGIGNDSGTAGSLAVSTGTAKFLVDGTAVELNDDYSGAGGGYTQMAADIQTQLQGTPATASYTASYDSSTGKITISNGADLTAVAITADTSADANEQANATAAGFGPSAGTAGSAATTSTAASFTVDSTAVTLNGDYSAGGGVGLNTLITDLGTALGSSYTVAANSGSDGVVITNNTNGSAAPVISGSNTAATNAGLATGTSTAGAIGGSVTLTDFSITVGSGDAVSLNGSYDDVDALAAEINKSVSGAYASVSSGVLNLKSSSDLTLGGTDATGSLGFAAASVSASSGSLSASDTLTVSGALDTIQRVDSALSAVNTLRSTFGAVQNRFDSVIANLSSSSENLSAARSRIQDADFASETATLTRGQILQQAGTAMLAQANSLPNGVLALLRG